MKYGIQGTYIHPNSIIFLYTDGLTEAMDSNRKMFGIEQVGKVLESCPEKHPKEIVDTVSKVMHRYIGYAEQCDDLTVLVIRYTSKF